MPVEFLHGSLEGRVLKYLLEAYPVTAAQLARDLHIPEKRLERTLKALEVQGIVELEALPDRTYVRLLRRDLSFYGYKESQRKRLKRSGGGKREEPKEPEGPMYA